MGGCQGVRCKIADGLSFLAWPFVAGAVEAMMWDVRERCGRAMARGAAQVVGYCTGSLRGPVISLSIAHVPKHAIGSGGPPRYKLLHKLP